MLNADTKEQKELPETVRKLFSSRVSKEQESAQWIGELELGDFLDHLSQKYPMIDFQWIWSSTYTNGQFIVKMESAKKVSSKPNNARKKEIEITLTRGLLVFARSIDAFKGFEGRSYIDWLLHKAMHRFHDSRDKGLNRFNAPELFVPFRLHQTVLQPKDRQADILEPVLRDLGIEQDTAKWSEFLKFLQTSA